MNKTKRQGTFFIAIFVVMIAGVLLLDMTVFQCLILLSLFALVMKLTDIEDSIGNLKK